MKILFLAAALSVAASAHAQEPHADHQLGTVDFEISCNTAAQARFNRALAWLHSFEYQEAENDFLAAASADPKCAMAHWGVAASNYHPLWAPPTAQELEKGRRAIEAAKSLGGMARREADFVAALDEFYRGTGSHKDRVLAYVGAMEQLHRRHPADQEAAVFYALALIAAGTMDDDASYARESQAAKILNGALARAPHHPGVSHYLIHGYDYPALAHLALPAARTYAGIAPASSHAQHMPSHIFTRLGLWQEGIQSNLQAEAAARAYAARHNMAGSWDERLHAMDYLAYSYLQLGQDEKARELLRELNEIKRVDPPNFKVAYAFSVIPARFALERRQWNEAAALALSPNAAVALPWSQFPWAEAQIHFARSVGAARGGNLALARVETAKLGAIRRSMSAREGEYDWATQLEIEQRIAAAWLAAAEKRSEEALAIMRSAAELDDATEKHPVMPSALLPAREQYGELLLELGRPAEALAAFQATLARAPGRRNALRGAALAEAASKKP
jgi:tetratricopeptide (TPR) repeat protein